MKYRRIQISGLMLIHLCGVGNIFHSKCIEGLPIGARFAYCLPDSVYGIYIVVEHESFDELKDGDEIPIHPSPIFERLDRLDA